MNVSAYVQGGGDSFKAFQSLSKFSIEPLQYRNFELLSYY